MSKTPTVEELRQLIAHLEGLQTERLAEVEDLGEYIITHRGFFSSDSKTDGQRRNQLMINNAPLRALRTGAAGLTSGMTPASLPWFKHEFISHEHRELKGARSWADMVDERLSMVLGMGGFYQAIQFFNQELIGFGSALLYVEASMQTVAHYECCTWGTWLVSVNSHDKLECVVRHTYFTAKEAVSRFGENSVSIKTRKFAKTQPYELCRFTNIVQRRPDADTRYAQNTEMPFGSYWLEDGFNTLVHESGYAEMPYMYATWENARGIYGTGPGDDALGDARQLDAMERRKLIGMDKILNPPMTKPASLKGRIATYPGGETPINTEMERVRLSPLYDVNFASAVQIAQQEIQTVSTRINEVLLATVFADSPIELRPAGITATEWAGRRRERIQMMGPTLATYEPNVLNAVLERTYGILDREGHFPPPPESLGPDAILNVEYLSPLAQALRSNNAENIMGFLSQISGIIQMDAQVVDKLNTDQIIDELARANGAPGSIVKSDEEVVEIRQARAEAQAKAQQQQQQMAMLAQVKQLAETKVGEGTLAGTLIPQEQA